MFATAPLSLRHGAMLALAAFLATPALGADMPKAVVELFTSQGCSSCPPADKLLGAYATDHSVVALTLAVDYWDYLGWKDTLGKHGHSTRQKAYAAQRGDGKVFTPQIVVNGVAMAVGNEQPSIEKAMMDASARGGGPNVPVTLATSGDSLDISIDAAPAGANDSRAEIWLCPMVSAQAVDITRGENKGTTVTYHNVVRRWVKLGDWSGKPTHLNIRTADIKTDGVDAVAVLVQTGSQQAPGTIIGAATLNLR